MLLCRFEDLFGFLWSECALVAEHVDELGQLFVCCLRDHLFANLVDILIAMILKFFWNDMRAEQGCDNRSGPARCCVTNGLQGFKFGVDAQTVAGLCLDGRRSVLGHFMEGVQYCFSKCASARFANAFNARANASASFGDLLVVCAQDTFLEIHEARVHKGWMGVRVYEAWQDDLFFAVDFDYFLTILSKPRVAEGIFGFANGNNLARLKQDRSTFKDA
jgi:hypothetical protein